MKIALFGAYGKLGTDILITLAKAGHEVKAYDMVIRDVPEIKGLNVESKICNVTKPDELKGTVDGVDVVITTVGLTGASKTVTNFDIDYQGNLNIVNEAKKAKVKHFVYISVINADLGKGIPMVESKYMLEEELKKSGLTYVIHRPTGYFYDIAHVFWPMIKKGSIQLLKGTQKKANVIDTKDFAKFIMNTMMDKNKTYSVGGMETYTYQEIGQMFWEAAGNEGPVKVKYAPIWMFDILAKLPKIKKEGKSDVIKFSKFTLGMDCFGCDQVPGKSFKEYIKEKSYAPRIEAEMAAKEAAKKDGTK